MSISRKLTIITGGIASGKSAFAIAQAKRISGHRIFVATARPTKDLQKRIKKHREERGKDFETFSYMEYKQKPLYQFLSSLSYDGVGVLVLDCLTLWLADLVEYASEDDIMDEAKKLCMVLKGLPCDCFVVTDQIGLGGVVMSMMHFQRLYGLIQQHFAYHAHDVYMLVMGCPILIQAKVDDKNTMLNKTIFHDN